MKIDRLTFVADWAKHVVKRDADGQYTQLDKVLAPLLSISRRSFARWPYRYQFVTDSGVVVQVADKNSPVPPLRFDFNPQKTSVVSSVGPPVPDFKAVLTAFRRSLTGLRVTRLDYCQDYDLDLSGVNFTQVNPVKTCEFRSRLGKLETRYLGSTDSPLRFRIYNKALERSIAEPDHYHGECWRIEAQLRFKPSECFRDFSPFEKLQFCNPVVDALPIKDRAMVEYLLLHPEGMAELSKRLRRKYKELLVGDLGDIADIVHPHTIFLRERDSLFREIDSILSIAEYKPHTHSEPVLDSDLLRPANDNVCFTECLNSFNDRVTKLTVDIVPKSDL